MLAALKRSRDNSVMARQQISTSTTNDSDEANWHDLADHLQIKVNKRTSEVAFLQTKAGFLIAASVIALQSIISQNKMDSLIEIALLCASFSTAVAALIVGIVSMHISKSATPLNPDDMILKLTEDSTMSRRTFSNWLAKSYAKTNTEFNKSYGKKYKQQMASAILIVVSFILLAVLKGIEFYV